MERYHIIKLGLAFTFYAAYCVRPMLVNSLQRDNEVDNNPSQTDSDLEYFNFFQGVEGRPGVDFPVYSYIPKTSFSCKGIETGYYADLDTGCQVFHICDDSRKISFLCPNGTIFQQSDLICEWWNKVNCTNSPSLYEESAERLQNDVARRKASRRVGAQNDNPSHHGAVMRTEERFSVRVTKPIAIPQQTQRQHRVKNHRIPDNSDIEHQIEQAESNNRHLANAQNSIQTSQKDLFGVEPQKPHDSHASRSRQSKKDIDKETGNFLNTNYDQSARRDSKKIGQQRSSVNYATSNQGYTPDSLKEYHVQFSTTSSELSATTRPIAYSTNSKSTEKFLINISETVTSSFNNVKSTTPVPTKTKFAYGSTVKERFNSYDARLPSTTISTINNRGSVKYYSKQNSDNAVTTYSPLTAKEGDFQLPPFPKHKSELAKSPPGFIKVNTIQSKEEKLHNLESGETQVPQETAAFAQSGFNTISDSSSKYLAGSYPNHRNSYSEVKNLNTLQAPKKTPISSITPHLVTTQPINNGKPFVGSRIGTTLLPNQPTTQSKYTYLPTSTKPTVIFGVIRHSSTTEIPKINNVNNIFNSGKTDKTLPPIETSTPVTNSLPTDIFNVGRTDTTLKVNVVPDFTRSTTPPVKVYVPEEGSFNVGQTQKPVKEPPFIKKTIPLLYSKQSSTERAIDQATVYGNYPSSTPRNSVYTKNTPYSPTVPTVTQSSLPKGRTSKSYNNAVPVRFGLGQEKISIHLSKNVGGSIGSNVQFPNLKIGAVLRVADEETSTRGSTIDPGRGFYVTKGAYDNPVKSKIEKPRPFSKSVQFGNKVNNAENQEISSTAFPSYHISSARPFGVTEATSPTPFVNNQVTAGYEVYNNIDNMIGILQEIATFNAEKEKEKTGQGLAIPPSVSPQTLHSLAQYFANELQKNDTESDLEEDSKEKLTTLLTAMTVHGYHNLFNAETYANTTEKPETTTVSLESKVGVDQTTVATVLANGDKENEGELLATTSLPELRQLARNFSLALSSYLNDPDSFRKSLESVRPTEPPPLEGSDTVESSTTEDELLNFSDADIRPSTPAAPSPTWGYILATEGGKGNAQEDVKNSLNPDLNTADSQSFVPRFNNVPVDDKRTGSTDLPLNHWTSSPRATNLWQKAFSVNPSIVNDNLETTTYASLGSSQEQSNESELFNTEVSSDLVEPVSEISYDLRELPPLSLNSTQVHGILIDFMNHTKSDEHNRLNRILKKLNTSEEEFLNRMKEIESNPLTKRLILLLISECGANVTQDLGISASNQQQNVVTKDSKPAFGARINVDSKKVESENVKNHYLGQLVHPHLSEDEQDTRALHLLNSLYTIASRFGRKR